MDNAYIGADGARPDPHRPPTSLEFAVVWEQSGVTTLHTRQTAAMSFCPWTSELVGVTPNAEDAVAIDLDGDGDRDVIVCMEGTQRRVAAFVNRDGANFGEHTFDLPAYKWMISLPTDLDNDGRSDFVAAARFVEQNAQGVMAWIRPGADPTDLFAWRPSIVADVGWPMALLALDMDGDGDDDLVVADRYGASRGLKWIENPAPHFEATPWPVHMIGLQNRRVRSAAAFDVDGDGDIDFVSTYERVNLTPPGLVLLDNTGSGWIERQILLPPTVGEPKAVVVGDFDLDGLVDVALSCESAYDPLSGVCVFLQRPGGVWAAADVAGPEGCKFDVLTAVDIDGDGDLDLVTTEEGDNGALPALGVVWYENPARRRGWLGALLPWLPGACDDPRPSWLEAILDVD